MGSSRTQEVERNVSDSSTGPTLRTETRDRCSKAPEEAHTPNIISELLKCIPIKNIPFAFTDNENNSI